MSTSSVNKVEKKTGLEIISVHWELFITYREKLIILKKRTRIEPPA